MRWDAWCIANHVPQKDTWRITLTWPVINQGGEVVFEPAKARRSRPVLARGAAGGPRDPERLPSQLIRPRSGKRQCCCWMPPRLSYRQSADRGVCTRRTPPRWLA